MRRVLAVALKEFRQIARDPLSLVMLLGIPAGMLLLYGYALDLDVRNVKLAVQDRDHSAASRELVERFVRSGDFKLEGSVPPGTDLEEVAAQRRARSILVIPERYGDRLAAGETARAQLLLDGSDALTASTVLGYAGALVVDANRRNLEKAAARAGVAAPRLEYHPRIWFNPDLKSTQFLVPGLIGFILMLTAVVSTALSVVREKERGTLEQLRLTALGPGHLIVGKVIPYLLISLTATALILLAAWGLFGVEVRGSYVDLFAATLLYLFGALGFGLLVSSFADSQAMAFQVGTISSMLPAIFLSGFIFSIRSMPPVLQWITYAVPARYYLVILRGVILKGAGLGTYAPQASFLAAYAVVVVSIAWVRLVREEG